MGQRRKNPQVDRWGNVSDGFHSINITKKNPIKMIKVFTYAFQTFVVCSPITFCSFFPHPHWLSRWTLIFVATTRGIKASNCMNAKHHRSRKNQLRRSWTKLLEDNFILEEHFGIRLWDTNRRYTHGNTWSTSNWETRDASNLSIDWTVALVSIGIASCENYTDICYILENTRIESF